MSPREAVILWCLARCDLALACAAAALWKLEKDGPAERFQFRRVLGQLLPGEADACQTAWLSGATPGTRVPKTAITLASLWAAHVDADEAARIARYMRLRDLPPDALVSRWASECTAAKVTP